MTGTALSCTRKSVVSTVFYSNFPASSFHLAILMGLLSVPDNLRWKAFQRGLN